MTATAPPIGAAERAAFAIDADAPLELVRSSSNDVYRGQRRGQPVYLRVTPAWHRAHGEVAAEVAWMDALAAAGLRIVAPIRSVTGQLVQPIESATGAGALVCLTAAPGRAARKPDDYTPAVIDSWADLLVALHAHERAGPTALAAARPDWRADRVFQLAREATGPEVAAAQEILGELVTWMEGLPTSPDGFGLTHADLHLGNLSVGDDGTVTAFDFDDSCRHFFAHDVGVAVTSIRKAAWEHPGRFDAGALEDRFVARVFAGGGLAPAWRGRLEAFVAYRIALSACWAARAYETGVIGAELEAWYRRSLPWWLGELAARGGAIRAALGR